MSEALDLLNREIEQLLREKEDFLDITTLPGLNGWEALVRKIDAEERMKLDALLIEADQPTVRYLQGFLAALTTVKQVVNDAEDQAKLREEEVSNLVAQKDEYLEE